MPIIGRNAQSFYLGSKPHRTADGAAFKLGGTAQINLLLEDLILTQEGACFGAVESITLAGQSLMTSDSDAPIGMWASNAQLEGFRSVSCPIGVNQKFEVSGTMNAAANLNMAVSTSPITAAEYVPTSQLGSALNYVFGVTGKGTATKAASTTFQATCLRSTVLGRIVIVNQDTANVTNDDLFITSIKCEGIELLSGEAGNDSIGVDALTSLATDLNGLQLAYPIQSNGIFQITVENKNAANDATIGIGIYCLPAVGTF